MARPKGYFTADGEQVPSVTTILSRFKDAGGLVHWAWDLGMKGLDYREERQKAASIGTVAHSAIDAFLHDRPFSWEEDHGLDEESLGRAKQAFRNGMRWIADEDFRVVETETPMVSERYRYGGTPDVISARRRLAMGDWKTSNRIYPEYLMQLAAYGKLWEEHHPDRPLEDGFYLLRFDKDYGDFAHFHWDELDAAWEAFLHLRETYDLLKILKRRSA